MRRPLTAEVTQPFMALLLAAGEGSRLGGVPKCLLRMCEQTLLERQIFALMAAGASNIVVVTGFYFTNVEAELTRIADTSGALLQIVRNPQPEQGQQSSVLLGLAAIAAHQTHLPVLIALADQPLMEAADYCACLHAFDKRPPERSILYPIVNQQRGNPVLLTHSVMQHVLESGQTCRDYIHSHPDNVHRFITAIDHFVFDIDTASDLDRFHARTGMTLSLPSQ
ncbi:MAG: nucleotidyltransferase family protein [Burkholderiaceae bacterium]|nr:nucleotidyltransferase family protein [Burkholderiaceae bacterium]